MFFYHYVTINYHEDGEIIFYRIIIFIILIAINSQEVDAIIYHPGMYIVPFILKNFPPYILKNFPNFPSFFSLFDPFLPFLSPFIPFSSFFLFSFCFFIPFSPFSSFFFFSHLYNLKIFPNDLKKSHPPSRGGNTEQYTSLLCSYCLMSGATLNER